MPPPPSAIVAKSAEPLLATSEVEALLATAGCAVFICDPDGLIGWASPSCAKVLGHKATEMVGASAWHLLIAAEDLAGAAAFRARLDNHDVVGTGRLLRPDGARHCFALRVLRRNGLFVVACQREFDAAKHAWTGTAIAS